MHIYYALNTQQKACLIWGNSSPGHGGRRIEEILFPAIGDGFTGGRGGFEIL